jgi:hypothetical protein
MGWVDLYLEEVDAAIEQLQVAMRVSPRDPRSYATLTAMANACRIAGMPE